MGDGNARDTEARPGRIMVAILAALGLLAGGCGAPEEGRENTGPLRVAAASDLQDALPVLARRFTERTQVEVVLSFGASGQLAEQIKAGAPFDVFLAANQEFVRNLAAVGDIRPDSVRPYARGALVLAVHRESGSAIQRLEDL